MWLPLRLNAKVLASKNREQVVADVIAAGDAFTAATGTPIHYSGLPFIRTRMAMQVQKEMKLFLVLSLLLTAGILALFFRSVAAVLISMLVVAMAVIWSTGTIVLLHFKITLLTALIPPLIVVIGIPNCIYLLNQYHLQYRALGNKEEALKQMIAKMGVVTLVTNITAAIGFGVFAFTKSAILKEFGLVAGINILAVFVISIILIPGILSYLAPPTEKQMRYLNNRTMTGALNAITSWVFGHRKIHFCLFAALYCCRRRGRSEGCATSLIL